jgi:hypothetical protein
MGFFDKVLNHKQSNPEPQAPPHTHDWELVAKTFVEPRNMNITGDAHLTQIALTGITTFLFQCVECKEFRKEECPGLETTTLDKIIEKVDISGPEYIVRGNSTYILMRRPDNQALPVR